MSLIQDDDVVQALAAERANHPFARGILPGRTRSCDHFLSPQARQAASHLVAIDGIAVTDQVTRSRLEGERLVQLLTDTRHGWRRGKVKQGLTGGVQLRGKVLLRKVTPASIMPFGWSAEISAPTDDREKEL